MFIAVCAYVLCRALGNITLSSSPPGLAFMRHAMCQERMIGVDLLGMDEPPTPTAAASSVSVFGALSLPVHLHLALEMFMVKYMYNTGEKCGTRIAVRMLQVWTCWVWMSSPRPWPHPARSALDARPDRLWGPRPLPLPAPTPATMTSTPMTQQVWGRRHGQS